MKIIDAHCDVLYKLFLDRQLRFDRRSPKLDVTLPGLRQAGVMLQFFAIFLPEKLSPQTFDNLLEYIGLFHQHILVHDELVFVKEAQDIVALLSNNKIGALLSLEGVGALAGHLPYLQILQQLGLRSVGITWNHANWAADGVMEPRKGGFTVKGKQLIKECNRLGLILDVSHLSVNGFWELVELSGKPFIASHSNAFAICPHPRNLTDEQITAIIHIGGRIGITFVPWFVSQSEQPSISHLLQHIDHICSLGGSSHIGFGSDFDGIEQWIPGLRNVGDYDNLVNELVKHYKMEEIEGFLYKNWYNYLISQLK